MNRYNSILRILPEVLYALRHQQPVVSLQSTIISHGMPYPNNKKCALQVQSVIRQHGCIPATIALIDGQICIGLDQNQIEQLARNGSKARKVSRRDLPYVLAQKGLGSTTVAGTMICSALAGIDMFVTGGLGGVHRDFSDTMDVSADLRQLGRTPVNVISAGVKNILDIPRTIQYLETEGVPVITYGSKYFPAFFTPSSGIESPLSMDSLEQISDVLIMRKRLDLKNGILIGVPAQDSGSGKIIQQSINSALKQAHQQGIKGAATTPFLLKRVHELSGGVSVTANINLIKRNAEIGAQLAKIYTNKKKELKIPESYLYDRQVKPEKKGKIIVIGGCAVDFQVKVTDKNFQLYQSCTGLWKSSFGGVGRNIAEVSKRLNSQTVFITALGNDKTSQSLKTNIISHGIQLHQIKSEKNNAPTYLGILDNNNDSIIGVSDMKVNDQLTFQNIYSHYFKGEQQKMINPNDIVIIDANICDLNENLLKLLKYLNDKGYFIIYECKGTKSIRVASHEAYQYVSLLKMNDKERQLVFNVLKEAGKDITEENQYRWFGQHVGVKRKNNHLTPINTIITKGVENIKLISKDSIKQVQVVKSNNVIKTTGAGDTMTGAISSFLMKGYDIQKAVKLASIASKMTVQFQGSTISDKISIQKVLEEFQLHNKTTII